MIIIPCSGMFRNVPCSWFYRRPLFGAYLRARIFEYNFYSEVTGPSVRESDGLPFVEIESNFQSSVEGLRGLAPNKETQLYSHTRGKKTERSPFCG